MNRMLPYLPADFAAAIVIVQHLCPSARYKSMLNEVLGRATVLPVKWAEHRERLKPATIYLASQDHQTVLTGGCCFRVFPGVRVNYFLPAADPLFLSAAEHFGSRSIGVILSGSMSDGVAGAERMCAAGAVLLVQDEESSESYGMPHAARKRCKVAMSSDPETLVREMMFRVTEWMRDGAFAAVELAALRVVSPLRVS